MAKSHLRVANGLYFEGVTTLPADAINGDVVFHLTDKKFKKYLDGAWRILNASDYQAFDFHTDGVTTGLNAALNPYLNPFIRLTNASLLSVDSIPAGSPGEAIFVSNVTGNTVTFNNLLGPAGNQINTGTNKPIKLKAGGTLYLVYDHLSMQWRVIGGAGGGDTEGLAFEFTEGVRNRLEDSNFEFATPVIFLQKEDALTDGSSTAVFNTADAVYDFPLAGDVFLSQNLYGAGFLSERTSNYRAEIQAKWLADANDTVYEVSKDGGSTYSTITMNESGTSGLWFGQGVIAEPVGTALQSYPLIDNDSNLIFEDMSNIAYGIKLAQFTKKTSTKTFSVQIQKLGMPDGLLRLKLVKDNMGSPSTDSSDIVGISPDVPIATLLAGLNTVNFTIETVAIDGDIFHAVIETDDAYKTSFAIMTDYIALRADSSSPSYSEGLTKALTGTTYADTLGAAGFELLAYEHDLRLRITSATNSLALSAFAVLYAEVGLPTLTVTKAIQSFTFSGDDDVTDFTVTNFLPDPDTLKVYDITSGQVYRYPAFSVNGSIVQFEAGQFLSPGEEIRLLFDQTDGGGYDNSDTNALLLAQNFLGSLDPNLDRSLPGRGIFLRRPDGTLREITIDNNDNIQVYSV